MTDRLAGGNMTRDAAAIPEWLICACTATLCAALLVPFGALPGFDTGYYELVAGSIQWLHFCAGLGAALLTVGLLVSPKAIGYRIFNPVSMGIAAFAVVTAIAALHADHPWLVFFGNPQSGKGVLWFLDISIFIALGWLIRDRQTAITAVYFTALATTAGVAGLRFYTYHSETQLLLPGGDSYAFLGLLLPFLTLLLSNSPLRRSGIVAAWLVAAVCVITSGNKAALIVFCILVPLYRIMNTVPGPAAWLSRRRFAGLFAAVIVIALALAYAVISIDYRGSFDSIDSRVLIAKILTVAQTEASPLQWAIGHGWGHTQGAFYRGLPDSGANLLDNRWDFLWRDIFHSHNLVLELVHEAGLVGFVTFCALLAALVAGTSPCKRMAALFFAVGYLVMNSVWFEFAHTVPMLALAVFALAHQNPITGTTQRSRYRIGVAVILLLAITCFGATAALHLHDKRVKPYKMKDAVLARTDFPAAMFPKDPRGDDFIRAATYREIVRSITVLHQTAYESIKPSTALSAILDDIEASLTRTANPELLLVGMVLFNDGHFNNDRGWLKPVVTGRESLWGRIAARHFALAPKRTDVLVVYLSWLVTNNRAHEASKLIDTIRRHNPDDPVALYFNGVIDTNDPVQSVKQHGLRQIGRSVELGVERFLIVPDWLKDLAGKAKAE